MASMDLYYGTVPVYAVRRVLSEVGYSTVPSPYPAVCLQDLEVSVRGMSEFTRLVGHLAGRSIRSKQRESHCEILRPSLARHARPVVKDVKTESTLGYDTP